MFTHRQEYLSPDKNIIPRGRKMMKLQLIMPRADKEKMF